MDSSFDYKCKLNYCVSSVQKQVQIRAHEILAQNQQVIKRSAVNKAPNSVQAN